MTQEKTYYGFAMAKNATAIWVLFGLYRLFMGLTEGIQKAFLTTIIPPDFKATAFGVYAAAVGLAMFPKPASSLALGPHLPCHSFLFRGSNSGPVGTSLPGADGLDQAFGTTDNHVRLAKIAST